MGICRDCKFWGWNARNERPVLRVPLRSECLRFPPTKSVTMGSPMLLKNGREFLCLQDYSVPETDKGFGCGEFQPVQEGERLTEAK